MLRSILPYSTLRRTTILVILILFASILFVAACIALTESRRVSAQLFSQVETILEERRFAVQAFLEQEADQISNIVEQEQLEAKLAKVADSRLSTSNLRYRVENSLNQRIDNSDVLSAMHLIDSSGTCIASTLEDHVGRVYADTLSLNSVSQRTFTLPDNSDDPFVVTQAIFSNDELLGALVIEKSVEKLRQTVNRSTNLGETVSINLASSAGKLLTGESTFEPQDLLYREVSSVGYSDWELVLKANAKSLSGPLDNFYLQLFALCFAAFIIASAYSYFLIGKVLSPLRLISQKARRVASGSLYERIELDGFDELSELGTHFDNTAEQLENQVIENQELREQLQVASQIARQKPTTFAERLDSISLNQLAKDTVRKVSEFSSNRRVEIDLVLAQQDISVEVQGEEFRSVLEELVSRAIRRTPSGGSVLIRTHLEGEAACIMIKDWGSPNIEHGRTLYKVLDASLKRIGGEVAARSHKSGGTCVDVSLPMKLHDSSARPLKAVSY